MNTETNLLPLFPLGQVVMTVGVQALVEKYQLPVLEYVSRHAHGDWGCVNEEDAAENALSLQKGFRLLSAYAFTADHQTIKLWVITESDRSVTTVLLPEEY